MSLPPSVSSKTIWEIVDAAIEAKRRRQIAWAMGEIGKGAAVSTVICILAIAGAVISRTIHRPPVVAAAAIVLPPNDLADVATQTVGRVIMREPLP